jgi:putative lipoic acid-binding regulatory protein
LGRVKSLQGRPLLSYPCSWTYRIVCTDEAALRTAVALLVGDAQHTLTVLGTSASGRYRRIELELRVRDESQRNEVFAGLGRAPGVHFVL